MPTQPATPDEIRRAAAPLIVAGRLTTTALADRLSDAGLDLGADPGRAVRTAVDGWGPAIEVADGWAWVPDLLEGTTWCTPVSAEEAGEGLLPTTPDLDVLAWWALDDPLPLAGGGAVTTVEDDDDELWYLSGPPGWLDGCGGRVATVSVRGGELHVGALDAAPPPHPDLVTVVQQLFASQAREDALTVSFPPPGSERTFRSLLDSELLWEALAADHAAVTAAPIPPLADLVATAGLQRSGNSVLSADSDPAMFRAWQRRNRLSLMYELDETEAEWLQIVLGASELVITGADNPLGPPGEERAMTRLCSMFLGVPPIALAFWNEYDQAGTDPEDLLTFAERLLASDLGERSSGARWLAARALDELGRPTDAEQHLLQAVRGDRMAAPLVFEALAGFAADRGDSRRALQLLRDAGITGEDEDDTHHPLWREVSVFASMRPKAAAGRNDPCPCGSGRKYKACHLGKEQLPLADRAAWLYSKAVRYLTDHADAELVDELAEEMAEQSGARHLAPRLVDHPLVVDAALHEGEVWEDFVAERAELLPADEVLLAQQWQLVERSVFEVESSTSSTLSLLDLRTGDRLTVSGLAIGERPSPGALVLGRPLPVGDTWRSFSAFVPLPPHRVHDALRVVDDGDPFQLAGFVGWLSAPPHLQNTDGQETVFHELTWSVPDPDAARAALDGSNLHDDGDGHYTLVRDTANQRDTIVVSLQLDGDRLTVTANSDERADEARALVERLVPGATLVDHEEITLAEALARQGAGAAPAPPLAPDDPEVISLIAERVAAYEQEWLDLDVPALGGLTPRQAAADPIAREQLERLLASFPETDDPTRMSPARLRAALGL